MRTKILVIASGGGHFKEAIHIASKLPVKPVFVSYKASHLDHIKDEMDLHYLMHPRRNLLRLMVNFFQALVLLFKLKPRIVISTGADVAVPLCLLCRLFGAKLIFVESCSNVFTPTLTARILYPFANLFIVQWKEMQKLFPKSVYGEGPLL